MKFYAGTRDEAAANFTINFTSPTQSIKYDFTVYGFFISNFAVLEYGGCYVHFYKFFQYISTHKNGIFLVFFCVF